MIWGFGNLPTLLSFFSYHWVIAPLHSYHTQHMLGYRQSEAHQKVTHKGGTVDVFTQTRSDQKVDTKVRKTFTCIPVVDLFLKDV